MALLIDDIELAWRSLRDSADVSGWRSISIATIGPCSLLAGLSLPDKNEALLASFSSSAIPTAEKLPDGQGFAVSRVEPNGDGLSWLALTRSAHGSLELFAAMVADVAHAMDAESSADETRLLRVFLGRIRAWQEFMRKGAQALSPESEIGLAGELTLLRAIIDAGLPLASAIESWVGPLDGVRDFEMGTGSLEVKATLSAVAPGIAEALVATAIGLFAAIPAVVAYNRFSHEIDRLANRFESFMEEFQNILQRQMR